MAITPIPPWRRKARPRHGFTLIELIIVIAIIAISTAVITLSMRDGAQSKLDDEAARLAYLLEGARAESRVSGMSVRWEPVAAEDTKPAQFRFVGLVQKELTQTQWLTEGTSAEVIGARALLLGPEPLIPAQRVVLQLDNRRAILATDGLGPFVLVEEKP